MGRLTRAERRRRERTKLRRATKATVEASETPSGSDIVARVRAASLRYFDEQDRLLAEAYRKVVSDSLSDSRR